MHLINLMVNYLYRKYGVPIHDFTPNGPEEMTSIHARLLIHLVWNVYIEFLLYAIFIEFLFQFYLVFHKTLSQLDCNSKVLIKQYIDLIETFGYYLAPYLTCSVINENCCQRFCYSSHTYFKFCIYIFHFSLYGK